MKVMDFCAANCKNCYKCVRNCHVKAIKIVKDQAQIEEERCIYCGECFTVCPQNARNILSDMDLVKKSFLQNKLMIASVAPSYNGIYDEPKKLITALKLLGFSIVEETAVGAQIVTELYKEVISETQADNLITSCCPSVNLLIEKYYPSLVKYLLPIDTPMIVHSKLLKKTYGNDAFVAFFGPCISKKEEANQHRDLKCVDAVITFDELDAWIEEAKLDMDTLEETQLETPASFTGRIYPTESGILRGLEKEAGNKYFTVKVSGLEECKNLFSLMEEGLASGLLVEANACKDGCIGGPAVSNHRENLAFIRIKKNLKHPVIEEKHSYDIDRKEFEREFESKKIEEPMPTEEELLKILKKMGKHSKEDELNCSACGYNTCREKAVSVFQGMSHIEMCIPYMRTKAERLTDTIFYHSPNIIMILDENLNIIEFNPTAEKVFLMKANNIINKPISYLIDDSEFVYVRETKENILLEKMSYVKYGLIVLLNILFLPKQNIYLAIMHNITEEENRKKELDVLKENTLMAADDIINKQMRVVQEIAGLLGETTAETKVTLMKLEKIVRGEV